MYPTENETRLWVAINFSQRSIYRKMDAALKAQGLPPLRWYDVLWGLERAGKKGKRPFELESSLLFEQSNLSRLLRRMVNEALLEEFLCSGDRRGKILRISGKGRDVRKDMWKIYGPMIHEYMAQIESDTELKRSSASLNKLIDCSALDD
jgi:DNA-binding MarR family transcriptional regulator